MGRKIFIYSLLALASLWKVEAQTCTAFVGGYIPSWRNPTAVDYTKLTHVYYAFVTTNGNGELVVDSPTVFESFKTASVGKQRFISIGGAGDATVAAMAASTSVRQAFVSNCVTFCQTHSIHGIDMDWEGIINATDSSHYGALMRELATALHAQGLNLSATIGYGSYGGDFYDVGALKAADWIQLMVYDQTGTWAESPYGNHSTYQHMLDAIAYWTGRGYTNPSNMVIGLPFYGYTFTSTSGGLAQGVAYSEIVAAHPAMSCDWDEANLTVFNSPETIRKKVRYVIDHALKGVMIWEMGQDLVSTNTKSLLKAVSLAVCDQPAACDTFITTGVEANNESVTISPNPIRDTFTVTSDSRASGRIELISSVGQRVVTQNVSFSEGSEVVSVSGVAAGIYVVRVIQSGNIPVLRRVVVLN